MKEKITEIPKAYSPAEWEDKLYRLWEESGYFNPDKLVEDRIILGDAEAFSVLMPPPNVTGVLHLGHAMENALMDTMVRYKRMQGFRTLYLPGTDHAAIATQSKVEKMLHDMEGKTRHDLGRKEFLKRVETFAKESHDTIVRQVAKMGSSVDWSREAYTLDEKRSLAVRTAFKKMYDDGIIYRGDRIVNWDPKLQTTVSDDEIEYIEQKNPFYYLQYGPFVIGTVRPETKFGDKYVVMHPDDPRYKKFKHGQTIGLEWINGPITAVVIKDKAVDTQTGSGVMTITPAHSGIDFEIAHRHGLDIEPVINDHGILLPIAGEFAGTHIKKARPLIIEKLKEKGLVAKVDEHYIHNIATNSRGGGIIEPQIKRQWFVAVNKEFEPARRSYPPRRITGGRDGKKVTLKSLMQEAVGSGKIQIIPEHFKKIYFHWIDNLRDWCISRQLWYGHRIPVWYCENSRIKNQESRITEKCNSPVVSIENIESCPHCGGGIEQDPDTLDTWFSSGLWTFSTLGWPENTDDFKRFHPISWMQMGYEILFFWMARMILMTTYALQTIPFRNVYIHGMLRDKNGKKFSKSLDNGMDPLDVSTQYGTDALRITVLSDTTPGNDARFYLEKVEASRNLVNKLWNIARYILTATSDTAKQTMAAPQPITAADQWILLQLQSTTKEITQHLESYNFSLAIESLRDFTWNEFADWYVEIHKIEKNDAVLRSVFETLLKLWHPFMPFVTEALWQESNLQDKRLLMIERWPKVQSISTDLEQKNQFENILTLITAIRNIRSVYRIEPKTLVALTVHTNDPGFIESQSAIIRRLGRVSEIHTALKNTAAPKTSAHILAGSFKVFVHLEGLIDVTAETARFQKELADAENYAARLEARLNDPSFTQKAPKEIVAQNRSDLAKIRTKIEEIKKHQATLH